MPVSIDAASNTRLAEVGADTFLRWIKGAEWLFANAAEAAVLTGEPDLEKQIAALSRLTSGVILNLGAAGGVDLGGKGERRRLRISAPPVNIVDPTGAGEAFVAGVLASSFRVEPPETRLRCGVAAGLRAMTGLGGRPPPELIAARRAAALSSDRVP